jgi:hypothetical protein
MECKFWLLIQIVNKKNLQADHHSHPSLNEYFRALFYMPLYMLLHNLLNVQVQTANKMGL